MVPLAVQHGVCEGGVRLIQGRRSVAFLTCDIAALMRFSISVTAVPSAVMAMPCVASLI